MAKRTKKAASVVTRNKPLGPNQVEHICDATSNTLRRLLRFRLNYDVTRRLAAEGALRWRNSSERLDKSSVPAFGVSAHLQDFDSGAFDPLDRDNEPSENDIDQAMEGFPFEAVAASYVFSIVEEHGNYVVQEGNPKYYKSMKANDAWHKGVSGKTDFQYPEKMRDARAGYGRPFGRKPTSIPYALVHRLIMLKRARNAFIHEVNEEIDFDKFFEYAVAVVCDLQFFLVTDTQQVEEFPFEHDREIGKWGRTGDRHYREIFEDDVDE